MIRRKKYGKQRALLAFMPAWVIVSVYVLFNSISYYMKHQGSLYIALLIICTGAILVCRMLDVKQSEQIVTTKNHEDR